MGEKPMVCRISVLYPYIHKQESGFNYLKKKVNLDQSSFYTIYIIWL